MALTLTGGASSRAKRPGQSDQPALRHRVVELAKVAEVGAGADVDDRPGLHERRKSVDQLQRGTKVDIEDAHHLLLGEVDQTSVAGDPGVVDHQLQTPDRFDRGSHRGRPRRRGQVCTDPVVRSTVGDGTRSTSTSRQPSRASRVAMAEPIPPAAPVTSTG